MTQLEPQNNQHIVDNKDSRLIIASKVEPFLDLEIRKRLEFLDESVLSRFRELTRERLSNDGNTPSDNLINILAEIQTDLHYVKAALIESARYGEPNFVVETPRYNGVLRPAGLTIDMRSDITGSNWHGIEHDGRWSGPDKVSTVLFPSLSSGKYKLTLLISDEIQPQMASQVSLQLNGEALNTDPVSEEGGMKKISATVSVGPEHRLPFWTLRMSVSAVHTPKDVYGTSDERRLGVKVLTVTIEEEAAQP